jgi:hypothetical protein
MLLILVLALLVSAKFERQKCGPYLVTFNLTTTEEMNITRLDPVYHGDPCLHWQAGYWIIDAGTIVELQGDRYWEKKDVTAMVGSIHIERVGF